MGTARAQKESEDRETETRRAIERSRRRRDLEHRIERAQDELERLMAELGLEDQRDAESDRSAQRHTERMKRRREPDPGRGTVGDSE